MKNKKDLFINIVILLNILFICLYLIRSLKKPELFSKTNVVNTSLNKEIIPLSYDDLLKDIIIIDFFQDNIVISKSNKKIKVISIVHQEKKGELNIENLKYFVDIRNSFKGKDIIFIHLILGNHKDFSNKHVIEVAKRFNITIGFISLQQLNEFFHMSDCRCGCLFIVNRDNRIRLAGNFIEPEIVKEIIEREKYDSKS